MITINVKRPSPEWELWLVKNVGPRLHYLHNSIGGEGWIFRHDWTASGTRQWTLSFEDDRIASWFLIMFPQ